MSNVMIVPKCASIIANNSSILSFSCKNTLINKLFIGTKNESPITNPFSDARNSGLVTNTLDSLNESHPLGTGIVIYDKLNYNSNTLIHGTQSDLITPSINQIIFSMIRVYYQISILITCLNSFK